MQSTCVVCTKDYEVSTSTATNNNEKNYTSLYCSEECEKIDLEWLKEGNEIIKSAQANNPHAFDRTNLTREQETALNTFKNLGVKFTGSLLSDKDKEN